MSVAGSVVPLGVNVHEGVAVNVDVVVIPSIVNDSGTFGAFVMEIVHVSVPAVSVLHAGTE